MRKIPVAVSKILYALGETSVEVEERDLIVWTRRACDHARMDANKNGYDLWSQYSDVVTKIGGALVYSLRRYADDPDGMKTETIVRLVYPKNRDFLKSLFEIENFGLDVAESFGCQHVDNSKVQILKRRTAAVEFFDRISGEAEVALVRVEDISAEIRLIGEQSIAWKQRWGKAAWDFYRKFYVEYGEDNPHITFTKSFCMRGAKAGIFLLGS